MTKFKLTLTNDIGEVLGDWEVETDQTEDPKAEDTYNIDALDRAGSDLLEEVAMCIDMSDRADKDAAAEQEADVVEPLPEDETEEEDDDE